jgi:PAS domain S-box-containing protein
MKEAYQQFFEELPCYVTILDRDLNIIQANRRFREDFGEVYEGRKCYHIYKQRSEKCEVCPVERAFWDGRRHRSEGRITRQDGQDVSVIADATPLRNGDGEITAVMNMSTDVTQMKHLEWQLRTSQHRTRLLFEEVPCYVSIQDPDLRIIEVNRAFRETFGDSLGRKCYQVYKHRDEECWPCVVKETLQGHPARTHEEVVTSIDGKRMNVLVTTAPIYDEEGNVTSVMELSADITQVRQLQDQLSSLGLLIGSISHGLKGLLNGLGGGMYMVNSGLRKNDQARIQKGWEMVQRNVDRIKSVVSDILYYAKDRKPNVEDVSAKDLIDEVCGIIKPRAEEQNVLIDCTVEEGIGIFEADAQAVRAMLVNLAENAIDACRLDDTRKDHSIATRVTGTPEEVLFEIRDDGIGMDQETQEKAFSLFFSSKGMAGTGLGLFISNKIAVAHGGKIELQSEPGVGTRFTVTLPREHPIAEESRLAAVREREREGEIR